MLHVMSAILELHTKGGIEVFNLPVQATGDDLAVLQYTGGTTGISKGAMLTHRNLLANAMQTRSWIPNNRDGEEVVLMRGTFLPFVWVDRRNEFPHLLSINHGTLAKI